MVVWILYLPPFVTPENERGGVGRRGGSGKGEGGEMCYSVLVLLCGLVSVMVLESDSTLRHDVCMCAHLHACWC